MTETTSAPTAARGHDIHWSPEDHLYVCHRCRRDWDSCPHTDQYFSVEDRLYVCVHCEQEWPEAPVYDDCEAVR